VEAVASVLSGKKPLRGFSESPTVYAAFAQGWRHWGPTIPGLSIAWAMASCVVHEDPSVRSSSVRFFSLAQDAPDYGVLCRCLLNDDGSFRDTIDPLAEDGTRDLRIELARATVAPTKARIEQATEPTILSLLREEAIRPGAGVGVVAGMFHFDSEWLEDHLEEIYSATPESWSAFLARRVVMREPVEPVLRAVRGRAKENDARRILASYLPNRSDEIEALLGYMGITPAASD